MIRALVDFALNNKFVVLAVALLLLGWGAISFHNLPVEAYPDIADNYVTVITQWAGRSAEEALDPIAAKEVADLWVFIARFAFGQRDNAPMAAAERQA